MATAEITLYQFPPIPGVPSASPFCLKVHAALNHKGLPYQTRDMMTPWEIGRVSPTGKLPVLLYNGQKAVDSTDILRFLEEQSPEKPIYPTDPAMRARAELIEDWADESIYFHQMWHRWASRQGSAKVGEMLFPGKPAVYRATGARAATFFVKRQLNAQGLGRKRPESITSDFHAQLDWLDRLLEGNLWLVGDSISVADIAVGAQLRGVIPEWLPDQVEALKARSRLWALMEKIKPLLGGEEKGRAF